MREIIFSTVQPTVIAVEIGRPEIERDRERTIHDGNAQPLCVPIGNPAPPHVE